MLRVSGQPGIGNVPERKFLTEAGWLFSDRRLGLTACRNPPQLMQPIAKMPPEFLDGVGLFSNFL